MKPFFHCSNFYDFFPVSVLSKHPYNNATLLLCILESILPELCSDKNQNVEGVLDLLPLSILEQTFSILDDDCVFQCIDCRFVSELYYKMQILF